MRRTGGRISLEGAARRRPSRLASRESVVALLAVAAIAAAAAASPIGAVSMWAVDTTSDTIDAAPGDGICADAGGDCSLRAAVMEAGLHIPTPDELTRENRTWEAIR